MKNGQFVKKAGGGAVETVVKIGLSNKVTFESRPKRTKEKNHVDI